MFWALEAGQDERSREQNRRRILWQYLERPSHHSVQPVWQQQDDAIVADPLGLARADELVDDALSYVMKISKLGFPEDESVGTGHGKPQLET